MLADLPHVIRVGFVISAYFRSRSQYGDLHLAHRFGGSCCRDPHDQPHRRHLYTVTVSETMHGLCTSGGHCVNTPLD